MRLIVSNTGPLISLEKLENGFQFIRKLYDRILIPESVLNEATYHFSRPDLYLSIYGISDLIEVHSLKSTTPKLPVFTNLHTGETEAIQLALELKLPLLIEEDDGRKVAEEAGLEISGIAGQILRAFRFQLISNPEAREMLRALFDTKRLDGRTFQILLKSLAENLS